MAGQPLRKTSLAKLSKGAAAPVPYPENWELRRIGERVEHNLKLSTDQCYQILSWRIEECTPLMLTTLTTVALAHVKAGFRYMLDRANSEDRKRILAVLAGELHDENNPSSA